MSIVMNTTKHDTIAEFRIVKDNFSAKYPLSGSANIMVETKSGTNALHGAGYEYLHCVPVMSRA